MNRSTATISSGKILLDAKGVQEKVQSLVQAILKEFGKEASGLAVVGIQTRGAHLARRIAGALSQACGQDIPVGILDITLYRDDVHDIADQPEVKETDLPYDIQDRPLVLVDDVLFTGRTIRSAMNALIDYGRPRCIRLAVLVDRGHRELPIGADYTGLFLKTLPGDVVDVNLSEIDEEDSVRLRRMKKT
ncbi:MAG: bifunctional pyr operon transcriptional regulator/uracil phosphoribosyltransferase PyrR [Elusimicrobiota bacterium]|jgi:pyrimidine operon attenuation protein/uracil phosphoribosyltransferase